MGDQSRNAMIGAIILIVATALLIGGNQILYYITDNPLAQREIFLAEDVGSNQSIYTLNFNFSRSVIFSNYDTSNGKRLPTTFINVYSNGLLDNSTNESITWLKVNNNYFKPDSVQYRYSLQIDDGILNPTEQILVINKTSNLTLDNISITYKGIDYTNYDYDTFFIYVVTFLLYLIGIGFIWKR